MQFFVLVEMVAEDSWARAIIFVDLLFCTTSSKTSLSVQHNSNATFKGDFAYTSHSCSGEIGQYKKARTFFLNGLFSKNDWR